MVEWYANWAQIETSVSDTQKRMIATEDRVNRVVSTTSQLQEEVAKLKADLMAEASGTASSYATLQASIADLEGQVNKLISDITRLENWTGEKSAVLLADGNLVKQIENHQNILEFRGIKIGVILGNDSNSKNIDCSLDLHIKLTTYPYHFNCLKNRVRSLSKYAEKYGEALLTVNQVGGNDELIFDGSSMVFDGKGNLIHLGSHFKEDLIIFDTDVNYQPVTLPEEDTSWVYRALVLGFRDYFHKTGFKKTLLGLSGGIDSALVACIAVDALGKENVLGVYMPSRYSSDHSRKDAEQLAKNLEIEYRELPIEETFDSFIKLINGSEETIGDLAEENIQARIRGDLLMFISNRENRMLVNTSNKSEFSIGYTTLYGDMCGSLAPIADVPKTMVYKLCDYINRHEERIPINTINKPPSAELRPDQLDQDSLPNYDELDAIVQMYVEENLSADRIIQKGFQKDLVLKILGMIDRMEFKRRQAPPVLKVTSHTLGVDGKLPIIQRFKRQ